MSSLSPIKPFQFSLSSPSLPFKLPIFFTSLSLNAPANHPETAFQARFLLHFSTHHHWRFRYQFFCINLCFTPSICVSWKLFLVSTIHVATVLSMASSSQPPSSSSDYHLVPMDPKGLTEEETKILESQVLIPFSPFKVRLSWTHCSPT